MEKGDADNGAYSWCSNGCHLPLSVLPPGVVVKGQGSARFTSFIRDIMFEGVPSYFRPGNLVQGKVNTQPSAVVELGGTLSISHFEMVTAPSYVYILNDLKQTALV